MKVLMLLVKTCSNSCATLKPAVNRRENRNIIDNTIDNDHVDKAGQFA